MPSTPQRGRPRSAAAREAILQAAFGLLCERGYADMAIEAVAARAGVGKTTIYRWWPDRAVLAVDAFFEATRAELVFPDTGTAKEDFRRQIQQLARLLRGQPGTALAAMIAGARTDETLRRAVVERWVIPRKRWGRERMQRARQDGELSDGVSIDAALDVLYGPLYARLLIGLGAPSVAEAEEHLDIIFRGIFLPADSQSPPGRRTR